MSRLAILADDLTGACDAAVPFRRQGCRTAVGLKRSGAARLPDAQVVALNSESRGCVFEEAYRRVRQGLVQARALGCDRVYKKVDSTMRGPVGRELDAVRDEWGTPFVVLAPAFPATGRTVEAGQLLVKGRPVADSPFAHELPAATSDVSGLVSASASGSVAPVPLGAVRGGPGALEKALMALAAADVAIATVDATNEADLEAIAAVIARRPDWLGAGSAGLAGALARIGYAGPRRELFDAAVPCPPGAVLIVVGSRHPAAIEQRRFLERQDGLPVIWLEVGLADDAVEVEVKRAADDLASFVASETDVVLTFAPIGDADAGRVASERAAWLLQSVIARQVHSPAALVLTGGHTAAAVLRALDAPAAEILDELAPGISVLQLHRAGTQPLVVTKAGGFGGAGALSAARQYLKERQA
jgi:uncharacterized protein YgbK (DUF1537 family)